MNESTTELERSQARVETIYETSRVLGEIHDEREITGDVLEIAETILGFEMCSIQLLSAGIVLPARKSPPGGRRKEQPWPAGYDTGERRRWGSDPSGAAKRLIDLERR